MREGSMRVWMGMLLALGCGKEQPFDVEAYCAEAVDCVNRERPGYSTGAFEQTPDECIFQWESEKDLYTDAGCGPQWDSLEVCFANEELSCIYGAWGSSACLGEIMTLQDCVEENLWNQTSDTTTSTP